MNQTLRCVQCDYDLREQAHDAQCPECGLAVLTSREADVLALPKRELGELMVALRFSGWVGAMFIAITVVANWADAPSGVMGLLLVWQIPLLMMWFSGLVMLQGVGRQLPEGSPDRRTMQAMCWMQFGGTLGAPALGLVLAFVFAWINFRANHMTFILMAPIIASISCAFSGLIVQGRWLATLQQRLRAGPDVATRWRVFHVLGVLATTIVTASLLGMVVVTSAWFNVLTTALWTGLLLWLVLIAFLSVHMIALAQRIEQRRDLMPQTPPDEANA